MVSCRRYRMNNQVGLALQNEYSSSFKFKFVTWWIVVQIKKRAMTTGWEDEWSGRRLFYLFKICACSRRQGDEDGRRNATTNHRQTKERTLLTGWISDWILTSLPSRCLTRLRAYCRYEPDSNYPGTGTMDDSPTSESTSWGFAYFVYIKYLPRGRLLAPHEDWWV